MKPQFDEAIDGYALAKTIAARLPEIIRVQDKDQALTLLKNYRSGDAWLPEAMMLLNTKGFSFYEQERMAATLFPGTPITIRIAKNLCEFAGMVGRIGYSFPEWRFMAQGFGNDGSLFERYGFEKLNRSNDLHDPTLPSGHPDRDNFGTGYVMIKDDIYLEYRRAYVLYAKMGDNPVSIVIRNNSFFFGRNRLPEPAYISWEKLSVDDLKDFDHRSLGPDGLFRPIDRAMEDWSAYYASCNASRVVDILQEFDWENELISSWLFNKGRPHLKAFMNEMLIRNESANKTDAPFYIALIGREAAPWKIWESIPATRENMAMLDQINFKSLSRFVLLSGPDGDFPIRPDTKPTSLQSGFRPSAPDGP